MVKRKCSKESYCHFLIATQNNFTATNFAALTDSLSHDSVSRFLSKTKLTPKVLWEYSKPFVLLTSGYLICDDSVLDHPYGKEIGLAKWQYSGTHHDVVFGIGLTTLLWTGGKDADEHIPVDFRIYAKEEDGNTKNDHFREMLTTAENRGFNPNKVLMDGFYASLGNLKLIREYGWIFVTRLKSNRLVSTAPGKENRHPLKDIEIPEEGLVLHLKGFGMVKVFLIDFQNGNKEYIGTNDLTLSLKDAREAAAQRWKIEEYHRGLKQTVGIEMCQSRTKRAQRTHIFCSILSFLALEKKRLEEHISWYEAKRKIISDALFFYLKQPMISLPVKT